MSYQFKQFEDVGTLAKELEKYASSDLLFWSEKYLNAIIQGSYTNISHVFIGGYSSTNVLSAVFAFQCTRFETKQLAGFLPKVINYKWFKNFLYKVLSYINLKTVILGNLMQTSENGILFLSEITPDEKARLINLAFDFVFKINHINLQLIINCYETESNWKNALNQNGFIAFYSDPDLQWKIPLEIKSESEYLSALHSKYRVRAKKVLKDSAFISMRELSTEEVVKFNEKLYELNRSVMSHVKFSIGDIESNYFSLLKQKMEDEFFCFGYFDNNQLIGFSTAFVSDNVYRAHFIGMDYTYIHHGKLYNRMLYDHVFEALKRSCSLIEFGRTATEIKTTVGAVPVSMLVFLKHRWKALNPVIHFFAQRLKPETFTTRNPFRES